MNSTCKKKQYIIAFLLFFLVTAAALSGRNQIKAQAQSQGVGARYHTQQEIRDFVTQSRASLTDSVTFVANPYTEAPYNAGRLSDATQQSAVNMLNQIRFIAGVSSNVTVSSRYSEYAQAAALLQYVNGQTSYNPGRPYSMDSNLYSMGIEGISKCNSAWAAYNNRSLNETLVSTWMNDVNSTNIGYLESRRWLLNPRMGQAGFGSVTGARGTMNTAYVKDTSNYTANEAGVAWPAMNMPVEYFSADSPWSISVGRTVNLANIQVTLLRYSDYKSWQFSQASSDGELYVNNSTDGQTGCIIFRPSASSIGSYKNGDSFRVTITGAGTPIVYSVQFFNLNQPKITYTTYFDSQGGSTIDPVVVQENSTITSLPVPVKANADFIGWFTGQNGSGTQLTNTTIINTNRTYYAYWRTRGTTGASSLSVTYSGGRYAGANIADGLTVYVNYPNGSSERVYNYSLSRQTLQAGTNAVVVTYNGLTQTIYISTDGSANNNTNVSQTYYELFFHPNGGTNLNYQKISIAVGDELDALPTVERANYLFKGWYTKPSGGTKVTKSSIPRRDYVLYAQWTRVTKPSRAAAPTVTSLGNGSMKVKVKSVSGAEGYEISYSPDSSFTTGVKKVATYYTSKTFKNLKKGETYYVRVRAYKLDSMGRKIYGSYSSRKGVAL